MWSVIIFLLRYTVFLLRNPFYLCIKFLLATMARWYCLISLMSGRRPILYIVLSLQARSNDGHTVAICSYSVRISSIIVAVTSHEYFGVIVTQPNTECTFTFDLFVLQLTFICFDVLNSANCTVCYSSWFFTNQVSILSNIPSWMGSFNWKERPDYLSLSYLRLYYSILVATNLLHR